MSFLMTLSASMVGAGVNTVTMKPAFLCFVGCGLMFYALTLLRVIRGQKRTL